ncbi:MAG TPA: UMP kinase [Candidatus Paceibacterota bacterium]
MEEKIIISLGGSLIIPEEIDMGFLKSFKELILSHVAKGKKFIIITGGGKIARKYQAAAKELSNPAEEDLDWIGIASLKLNAELLRVVFGKDAHDKIIADLTEPLQFNTPILIGSAYEPGHSTDWDAVMAAKNIGAKKMINLSNIDYVYDSDPRQNPNAKKIEKTSWAEYRKIIPKEWTSGLNSPFDPTASEVCEKEGIEVAIMNGKPIDNLAKYLNGEEFQGTVIS